MTYQEFRENGCPIGSGTVESAVKPFKRCLTEPGMGWLHPAVMRDPFVTLWFPLKFPLIEVRPQEREILLLCV